MSNLKSVTIVEHEELQFKEDFSEQDAWKDSPPRRSAIKREINRRVRDILRFLERKSDKRKFHEVECELVPLVFALGRLFLSYFLACRQRQSSKFLRRLPPNGYCR